jgi:hypothetical protein
MTTIQLFTQGAYGCAIPAAASKDGYLPGLGEATCVPHDSDYSPQD